MRKGVTLLELIIVISIIGILTAVVAPRVSQYLPGIQLNGSARTLASNLREAQERAVTEQNQHLIRFIPAEAPISYQFIRIYNSTEEILKQVDLPSGQAIILDPTISNNQIIFSADGGPSSSGNVSINNGAVNKTVNVSPAGFIKIQ